MLSELPKIEIPGPEGWDIREERRTSLTHRHFRAEPKKPLIVDYVTWEKYRERLIDVVMPALVVDVTVTHYWDDDKQRWWSTAPSIRVQLLNPRTMEPYSYRNPMSQLRHIRSRDVRASEEIPTSRDAIERVIVEATVPKTKITITITEEPLNV